MSIQCSACSAADPGSKLARGAVGHDDRCFRLYLAWFGDNHTVKVGLTAAERGNDRLYEQGALAWSFLAEGTLATIRMAEQDISAARLATERVRADRKAALWWTTADHHQYAQLLHNTVDNIRREVRLSAGARWLASQVESHITAYGLTSQLPESYRRLDKVSGSAIVFGQVRVAAGRMLLLDTVDGAVLIDTRRTAGWSLMLSNDPQRLVLSSPKHPKRFDAQPALF